MGNNRIDEMRQIADGVAMNSNPQSSSNVLIKNDEGSDIITKTDLTNKQVRAVTTLRVLAEMTGNDLYDELVNTFMNAQVSLKRQSRREFIQNNQSIRTGEEMKFAQNGGVMSWLGDKV